MEGLLDCRMDGGVMVGVLLAEDMQILRTSLVSLLNLEPDIEVVAAVGSGTDILATAQALRPQVAVLDIDLPGMDGIAAAEALHSAVPKCRTIILTGLGRSGHLRRALAAHVSGFLLKDTDPVRLGAAIREVASGGRVIDSEVALAALDEGPPPLTRRELDILRLAAEGEEVLGIAMKLFLSAGTVRNHLTTIRAKLNARNRVDAIRIAKEAGWL